ncbi:MAG: quinone-dependent dihydroorotate dehydrogenase [Bacteroidia bacterium]|nr:quinone-dependent dihydroorotate dehydrogenase [Bacteroidia bacterium]
MYALLRNLLFLLSPEKAHYFTMRLFKIVAPIPFVSNLFKTSDTPTKLDGLEFKNKVGLAAGFDKDGKFLSQLYALNFGFIEVGTVTPKPQSGNPKPRLFRLKRDKALINRMGFNNEGVKALKSRLQKFRKKERDCDMLIGVNIGKNKTTPNNEAVNDYVKCYEHLYDLADFFIVNVSSPNTPNLRELQNKEELKKIIGALLAIREVQDKWKPLYLKIAPDLSFEQLNEIIELQSELNFEGIVATNTSIDRKLLVKSNKRVVEQIGAGGISGAPVLNVSNSFVENIRSKSDMTIIGVGGIDSATSGQSKYDAGANLIEIYTGFIYQGPGLIKKLVNLN